MLPLKSKISNCFSAAFLLFGVLANVADAENASVSIRDGSIKWGDTEHRMQLLGEAPGWDNATMRAMFAVYRDSAHNQLPATNKSQQYNIEFINGMWGPVNNPFAKFVRPAKAFVSFNNSTEFLIAPLIKNTTDGNYHIFDKSQSQPILLGDWIANVATVHGGMSDVRFNVCSGYADNLSDSCSTKSYQAELGDALGRNVMTRSNMSGDAERIPSARRDIHEDWRTKVSVTKLAARGGRGSIYDNSIEWKDSSDKTGLLNSVNSWPNYKIIQDNFEKIRDIRYFDDNMVKGFARRISWLYPDDGCWTRATAVIKDLFGPQHNAANQFQRPSKIFAFGNLCVNTSHSSAGYVSWWYHTAPVIKDADTNQVYVLDPAVEPRKPLTVEQWMAAISANSGSCGSGGNIVSRFSICNGYGTSPGSRCDGSYQEEESTDTAQPGFQDHERARQVELGRNANAVLGDTPPWMN